MRTLVLVGILCACLPFPGTAAAAAAAPAARQDAAVMQRLDSLSTDMAALARRLESMRQDTLVVRLDTLRPAARVAPAGSGVATGLQYLGWRILLAIALAVSTLFVVRGLIWTIEAFAERIPRRRLLFKRLIPTVRTAAWIIAVYAIAAWIFEVDRQGLIAGSAALGIGLGLASQDVLKNILGGFIMLLDQPFQVGDIVRIGETYGEVVSIGLRSTRIVTLDDNLVTVPNSQIISGQVANASTGTLDCQVVTELFLPGWTDAAQAKRIAYEAAVNSRYVFLEKPVVVLVRDEFRETFLLRVIVKAYVIDTRYESALASEITEAAKAEFLRAGLLQPMWRPPLAPTGGSDD